MTEMNEFLALAGWLAERRRRIKTRGCVTARIKAEPCPRSPRPPTQSESDLPEYDVGLAGWYRDLGDFNDRPAQR